MQALSNNSINDRVLKAAKYGWSLCLLYEYLHVSETGQTTTGAEVPVSYPFMTLDLLM